MSCKIVTSHIFGIVNHEKLLDSAILEKIHVGHTFCDLNKKLSSAKVVMNLFI